MAVTRDPADPAAKDARLLTADEVIDRLSVHPRLRSAAATCVLPAVRVGTEWRFRASDLDAWIATLGVPVANA